MKKLNVENIVGKGVMRRVVLCAFLISQFSLLISPVSAQPKARRQQQAQQQKQQVQNQGVTMRARLMYPTAIDMPEEVVWRRDIYREIDLNKDANGGLYYPVEPMDKQLNLFTYVFKLALNGYIPVYEYRLDGWYSPVWDTPRTLRAWTAAAKSMRSFPRTAPIWRASWS